MEPLSFDSPAETDDTIYIYIFFFIFIEATPLRGHGKEIVEELVSLTLKPGAIIKLKVFQSSNNRK